MKNNITLIGINFYPEDSSTGLYSTQMAEHLALTHKVEVITGFTYYPEWEIRKAYKNKSTYLKEEKENITIYRYKQYVPKKPSFKKRILHLLDFTVGKGTVVGARSSVFKDLPSGKVCMGSPAKVVKDRISEK